MKIPYNKLQPDTLRRVIRDFVLREGTDYSHKEYEIETKIQQVLRQLKDGTAVLYFNLDDESFNILPKA
ncbi:MAG: YheU family protein [Myxococcota bacterium]|nr:YheU family protein [Myxococcota bacterium]